MTQSSDRSRAVVGLRMAKRPLSATGIEVSAVGLGAWQLGRSAEWPAGPDPEEAVRIARGRLRAAAAEGPLDRDTVDAVLGWYSERLGERALTW